MYVGNFNDSSSKYFYFEKVNGSHKSINLGNIFRNFLWEKKKVIDFFSSTLYNSHKVVSHS